MKNTVIGILVLLAVLVGAISVEAETFFSAADTGAPFVIRYRDSSATGTITVAAAKVTVSDAGTTNAYTYQDDFTPTLGELIADINSSTNASGVKNFEAVLFCGLAADALTNSFILARSEAVITFDWDYDTNWDVSNCKHYDVATSIMVGDIGVSAGKVNRVWGMPSGTGASTWSLYIGGVLRYINVIATNPTFRNDEIDVWVGNQIGFLRVANATTATTGGIGLNTVAR